jgi:hypothetical protein
MLLAWLMIFAHSVIPHNHIDDLTGSHQVICKDDPLAHDQDGKLKITNQPENDTVCHIAGLLFSQLNQDNILFHSEKVYKLYQVSLSGHISRNCKHTFIQDVLYDAVSLRAPPSA